jgi:hypothetical protein
MPFMFDVYQVVLTACIGMKNGHNLTRDLIDSFDSCIPLIGLFALLHSYLVAAFPVFVVSLYLLSLESPYSVPCNLLVLIKQATTLSSLNHHAYATLYTTLQVVGIPKVMCAACVLKPFVKSCVPPSKAMATSKCT